MFDIDDSDLKKLKKNLDAVHKYAFPDVVRRTLSTMAYNTSRVYKAEAKKALTIRGGESNIVLKSIHYEKAQYSEKDPGKMFSLVGEQAKTFGRTTEQLAKQEVGESIIAKGKHTAKATKFTRGGSFKRFVQKERLMAKTEAKKIENIAKNPVKGNTKKQFAQAIAVVHNTHKTINFIPDKETSGHKFGIFQFKDTGTVLKNGTRKIKGKAAKLLYSFKQKVQRLTARPMLKPATDKVAPTGAKIFIQEAENKMLKEMSKGLKK